mmetsp:Transcript_80921/g.262077  ORF Transcript_80921/g.262077 Transcript_80921/m.262077 type:complete len:81 (+) Transcript_80921:198-440(+)
MREPRIRVATPCDMSGRTVVATVLVLLLQAQLAYWWVLPCNDPPAARAVAYDYSALGSKPAGVSMQLREVARAAEFQLWP